jgi:hypothetical protein
VSANQSGKWGVWAIVQRAAPLTIAVLLGAGAMALLVDAGTVQPPSIGSRAASPPLPEKVVVSPSIPAQANHRPAASTASTAPQTSVAPVAGGPTAPSASAAPPTGSSDSPQSSGAGKQAAPKTPSTGEGSPTIAAPPPPLAASPAQTDLSHGHAKPHPLGLGHGQEDHPAGAPPHPVYQVHPAHPPHPDPGPPPGHLKHTPPGLARKAEPPRPHHDSGHRPPGRGQGDDGDSSHGNSHGEGHAAHGHGRGD